MNISDLSPVALKELEAKLESQLDLVRKVLALLEEHALTAAPAVEAMPEKVEPAAVYVPPVQTSRPDPKGPTTEVAGRMEGIFSLKQVDEKLMEQKIFFSAPEIRGVLNGLVKQGVLAVAKHQTGRGGCLYRRL